MAMSILLIISFEINSEKILKIKKMFIDTIFTYNLIVDSNSNFMQFH
jgi:hypothetical protein